MSDIERKSIKIRKPLHKEFCNCHPVQVFSVNGVPQFTNVDRMSLGEMDSFLEASSHVTTLSINMEDDLGVDKVLRAVKYNIPVFLNTFTSIPESLILDLKKVPHSTICLNIDDLSMGYGDVSELDRCLSIAKSHFLHTALEIYYTPYCNVLSLMETLDMFKNCASHAALILENTEYVLDHKGKLLDSYKEEIFQELKDFLKPRKVSLEIMEKSTESRVRHEKYGTSDLPWGIRPFFYEKMWEKGIFEECPIIENEVSCTKCEKMLYT